MLEDTEVNMAYARLSDSTSQNETLVTGWKQSILFNSFICSCLANLMWKMFFLFYFLPCSLTPRKGMIFYTFYLSRLSPVPIELRFSLSVAEHVGGGYVMLLLGSYHAAGVVR